MCQQDYWSDQSEYEHNLESEGLTYTAIKVLYQSLDSAKKQNLLAAYQ